MKISILNVLPVTAMLGFALSSHGQLIIDENFDAGYNRTAQNIAGGNMAVLRSRGTDIATVGPNSLSFTTNGTSLGADMFFNYFTDPGANIGSYVANGHILVGVGETLTVKYTFNLQTMLGGTTYSLRFGLFDDSGARQTTDLNGGGSSAAFNPNPGYALFIPLSTGPLGANQMSFRQHTNFNNNILSAAADFGQLGSTSGGTYNGLASATDYTLSFSVFRLDAGTTVLSASIIDANTLAVMTAGSAVNTGTQLGSFNWGAWRTPQQPDPANGGTITFKDINAVLTVPEPSTLVLAGLGILGAVFAHRRNRR